MRKPPAGKIPAGVCVLCRPIPGCRTAKALPSGEGAPEGGGRGAVECFVFSMAFGEFVLRQHLIRHGYAVPPSPWGKAWVLPHQNNTTTNRNLQGIATSGLRCSPLAMTWIFVSAVHNCPIKYTLQGTGFPSRNLPVTDSPKIMRISNILPPGRGTRPLQWRMLSGR